MLCKNIFAQPDGTYWIVVNTLRYPDPDEPDANGATINNMLALGHIVAGDTVEALAGEMGVDAANLQASIDAYNAVVEGGTDEFGFVADNAADAAMTEGPWYACRKVPTVHHTMGGIRVRCGIRGLQRRRRADSRLVRRRRVHRRHPRREPPGRQRHRRLHDLRPQRRHQRRKVRPGLAAL